ncbi:hypothetical protein [Micromonospora sp. NPDC048887]|uniref:hypothetical protein n=1 Tax=unclassified Micromonospora TaxID=2617518 RepID=UPI00340F36F8
MTTPQLEEEAMNAALQAAARRQISDDRLNAHSPSSIDDRLAKRRRASMLRERREAEYHQARVLILIHALSGQRGSLDGLTKLAKLDFLLRYPVFLEQLADMGVERLALDETTRPTPDERRAVESRMVRYKYGPWDDRYYGIIGALVGRGLVEYVPGRQGNVTLRPTEGGRAVAEVLSLDPAWRRTAARCAVLRKAFARSNGNQLKNLIYDRLPDVVDRPHRTEI